MSFRWMRWLALCLFAFSTAMYAQSLGDVARQNRAEQKPSGTQPRVYTNDDLTRDHPTATPKEADAAADDNPAATPEDGKKAAEAKPGEKSEEAPADTEKPKAKKKTPEEEQEAARKETERRTEAINKQYIDKINKLHDQIKAAQDDLGKLQRDKMESTYQFQRSVGSNPNIQTYEQEQRDFDAKITERRTQIDTLNSQLEDAKEEARHSGVPHATDY